MNNVLNMILKNRFDYSHLTFHKYCCGALSFSDMNILFHLSRSCHCTIFVHLSPYKMNFSCMGRFLTRKSQDSSSK